MKRKLTGLFACVVGMATYSAGQEIALRDEAIAADTSATMTTDTTAVRNNDVCFVEVEKMPEFPGGQTGLFRYLSANVEYPPRARAMGYEGRVVCKFVITEDGSVTDVEVVKSSGYKSLDKEAVRLITGMPKWTPGERMGKAVATQYTVPVNFKCK